MHSGGRKQKCFLLAISVVHNNLDYLHVNTFFSLLMNEKPTETTYTTFSSSKHLPATADQQKKKKKKR